MNSARGMGRVIVAGGGVLGTMHAVAARRRGFGVVHLEREPDARGASMTLIKEVCLLTGFFPATRDALLDALDWRPLIDLALSPADAGRGRPWPDLPLTALLRLSGGAVSELATVGDTPSDIESGCKRARGIVAGVLTGTTSRDEFSQAGATHVLDTVAGLPALLGL